MFLATIEPIRRFVQASSILKSMNVLLRLFHGIGEKNSQFVAILLWYLVCGHIIMYNEHQSSKNTFLDATIDGRSV
jgi:hypothetical protein